MCVCYVCVFVCVCCLLVYFQLNKLQSDINKNDCHIKAALAQINILKADNLSLEKDIEEKKQQVRDVLVAQWAKAHNMYSHRYGLDSSL